MTLGGGILWTSLETMDIDRRFNFQILYGIGVRLLPRRGPGWVIEARNHHISNAGTAGENLFRMQETGSSVRLSSCSRRGDAGF